MAQPLFDPTLFSPEQAAVLNNIPGQSLGDTNTPTAIGAAQAITPQSLTRSQQFPLYSPSATSPYPVSSLATPTPPLTPTPQEKAQSGLTDTLKGLYSSLTGKSAYKSEQDAKYGVDTIQTNINDLTAQLTGLKNEAAAIPLQFQQKTREGAITTAGLNSEQNQALLTNSIAALGVSTLLAASQGQLANASSLAAKAVAQKYDPIQEQIDATKANLDLIINDPATSIADKNRAQAQKDVQDAKAAEIERQKSESKDIWKIATDSAANGASFKPSKTYKTLSSALLAISKATTKEEALKIAGDSGLVFDAVKKTTTQNNVDNFNSAATNLQAQKIPTASLNKDGTMEAGYKKNLLDAGLPASQIDWLWSSVTGGNSFESIRQAIIKGGGDPKILDTFVTTLQG